MYLHYVMVSIVTCDLIDPAKLVKDAVNTLTNSVHTDATTAIDIDKFGSNCDMTVDEFKRMLSRREEGTV